MAARSISESVPVPAAAACFSLAFLVAEFSVFQFVLASLVVVFYVQLVESAFALLVGPVVGVSPPVVVAAAVDPAVVVAGAAVIPAVVAAAVVAGVVVPAVVVAGAPVVVPAVVVAGSPVVVPAIVVAGAPVAGAAAVGGTSQALDIVPDAVRIADAAYFPLAFLATEFHFVADVRSIRLTLDIVPNAVHIADAAYFALVFIATEFHFVAAVRSIR